MLKSASGEIFTRGAIPYQDRPVKQTDVGCRIVLQVKIEGQQAEAVLDTGGVYLLVNPEFAQFLDLGPANAIGIAPLAPQRKDVRLFASVVFRGTRLPGYVYRLDLTLDAAEGEGQTVEVTAFVPTATPGLEWKLDFPAYLGLQGCLECLRFAVDPDSNTFHFGPLGSEV